MTIRDLHKPLIAVALGLLPFVLFVGATDTKAVNEVVYENRMNVLGIILSIIGPIIASGSRALVALNFRFWERI